MNFLSGLALVLLTLVGYSSGCVISGRGRKIVPGIFDLLVAVVLWVFALATRDFLGKGWAILVWLLLGIVAGAVLMTFRRDRFPKPKAWQLPPPLEGEGLLRLWNGWKRFSTEMGDYQGRVLLIVFYFIIVTPFGVLVRLFSDPLHVRPVNGATSYWREHGPIPTGLEEARRQF